ncbi:22917_t:CDS:10 [Gigaspora rosea]|nr:22917_t:CDS:10 [Gigaspora rosea]
MSEIKIHEYFLKDPSNWSILGFLGACDLEPFDIKIDVYIKSLENIDNQEQGARQGRARELLESYRKASNIFLNVRNELEGVDRKVSKKWEKARKLDKVNVGPSINVNSIGTINGAISGGINNCEISTSKKRNQEMIPDDHKYRTKKTKSGRNIPNYHGFFDETSRPDMSEEENVIQNNEQQPENVYDKESKQGSTTSQSDDESDDREEHQDCEYVSDYDESLEEEIPTGTALADTISSWVLSSGKDVGEVLSKYREKIPRTKAYLYPAYFGILDLSGEDVEVKNLFTDGEWNEMIQDFKSNVNLKDLEGKQERPLYDLMDKIVEVLMEKPSDLITSIESCVIEDNIKINATRRLIQAYAYNLQRLQLPMSEVAFGSNFTNAITKGILTFDRTYHYEERRGEIQGLASSVITNMKSRPTDRSLIGQKVDFRISKDQFELLIGLRSGGLPSAPKSKKWMDKVDLAVALRDVLINEGIENSGVDPNKFHNLFTLGVHTFNYNYNIYGLDWKTKGVWRLGLLQKVKLPLSIDNLQIIEKLIISLMRVEETLHHIRKTRNKILTEKAKLYRTRRTSTYAMDYSICEHGRITRTRKAKE